MCSVYDYTLKQIDVKLSLKRFWVGLKYFISLESLVPDYCYSDKMSETEDAGMWKLKWAEEAEKVKALETISKDGNYKFFITGQITTICMCKVHIIFL